MLTEPEGRQLRAALALLEITATDEEIDELVASFTVPPLVIDNTFRQVES